MTPVNFYDSLSADLSSTRHLSRWKEPAQHMTPFKESYDVGEICWIGVGQPTLSKGRIIALLNHPYHPAKHYVIDLQDSEWPYLEIRDALTMSATAEGPLGFWEAPADFHRIPPASTGLCGGRH